MFDGNLMLECVVGGPIYRIEAPTGGLAAINGCHEFVWERVLF